MDCYEIIEKILADQRAAGDRLLGRKNEIAAELKEINEALKKLEAAMLGWTLKKE